jgi:predicted DCC family thiol-disulfide oxidoreductase YuxK
LVELLHLHQFHHGCLATLGLQGHLTHMPAQPSSHPIIVFDALCVLCSANAQFILANDKTGVFRLASMQGKAGSALYRRFDIDPTNPETMIVVDGDKVLHNSDAVLAIFSRLNWPWRALSIFKLLPRALRDPIYRLVAANRYKVFGKRETCWLPTPEQAKRVLS